MPQPQVYEWVPPELKPVDRGACKNEAAVLEYREKLTRLHGRCTQLRREALAVIGEIETLLKS